MKGIIYSFTMEHEGTQYYDFFKAICVGIKAKFQQVNNHSGFRIVAGFSLSLS